MAKFRHVVHDATDDATECRHKIGIDKEGHAVWFVNGMAVAAIAAAGYAYGFPSVEPLGIGCDSGGFIFRSAKAVEDGLRDGSD